MTITTACDDVPASTPADIDTAIAMSRQSASAFRLAIALVGTNRAHADELLSDADVATVLEADELISKWSHA